MLLRPAIFLDRDGTLNRQIIRDGRPLPPETVEQFELLPGVAESCHSLACGGFVLVVATNQPDVGRGTQRQEVVEAMHEKLRTFIPEIQLIEVCFDSGGDKASRRRKPEPGMLLDAAVTLHLDLARSWMIGDRWRDIDCGKRAGVRTVFIDFGYAEDLRSLPDFKVNSFVAAARLVLAHSSAKPTF